jgi:hypothetical protein
LAGQLKYLVQFLAGTRDFSSQKCPDQLWGLLCPLCSGHQGFFPQELRNRWVKLTASLYLVHILRMNYTLTPPCAFMACTGITSLYLLKKVIFKDSCGLLFQPAPNSL